MLGTSRGPVDTALAVDHLILADRFLPRLDAHDHARHRIGRLELHPLAANLPQQLRQREEQGDWDGVDASTRDLMAQLGPAAA